jgi:hypothetical protein
LVVINNILIFYVTFQVEKQTFYRHLHDLSEQLVQLSKQEAVTQQLVGQEAVTRQLSLTAVEDQLAELKSLAARLALHPGKPERGNRSNAIQR